MFVAILGLADVNLGFTCAILLYVLISDAFRGVKDLFTGFAKANPGFPNCWEPFD